MPSLCSLFNLFGRKLAIKIATVHTTEAEDKGSLFSSLSWCDADSVKTKRI